MISSDRGRIRAALPKLTIEQALQFPAKIRSPATALFPFVISNVYLTSASSCSAVRIFPHSGMVTWARHCYDLLSTLNIWSRGVPCHHGKPHSVDRTMSPQQGTKPGSTTYVRQRIHIILSERTLPCRHFKMLSAFCDQNTQFLFSTIKMPHPDRDIQSNSTANRR